MLLTMALAYLAGDERLKYEGRFRCCCILNGIGKIKTKSFCKIIPFQRPSFLNKSCMRESVFNNFICGKGFLSEKSSYFL